MRLREEFTLYRRKLQSGRIVWYYHAYDDDGRRISVSTGHTVKSRSRDYVLTLVKQNKLIPKAYKHHITFKKFVEPFWVWDECPYVTNIIKRGGEYSRTFCESNKKSMDKHITSYFGNKRVAKITVSDINTWLVNLPESAGVSRATANKMLGLIRIILAEAVKQNVMPNNPADGVKPLIEKANARDAFTKKEAKALLNDPEKWGNALSYNASLVCAYTGLRAGEIRALRVCDIHDGYLQISHSWDEKYGLKSTKSGKSREVPIPKLVHDALMEIAPDESEGFIFSLTGGKSPMSGRVLANALYRKLREIGITEEERQERGLSFHSWRHFFNTQLVAGGLTGEMTRAVVGHEDGEMTTHYLHLSANDMDTIRKIQDKMLVG